MVLEKCCWCIELELGAFIIAWFDLFYSITSTVINITQLSSSDGETDEIIFIKTANSTDEALMAITKNPAQDIRATHLAVNICMVIVAVALIYGLVRKNHRLVIGWLIINAIGVIFLGLAVLSALFLLFSNGPRLMLGVMLFVAFEFGIKFYIFDVIYSQFKVIYHQNLGINNMGMVNKPGQPLQTDAIVEYGAVNPPQYMAP